MALRTNISSEIYLQALLPSMSDLCVLWDKTFEIQQYYDYFT